MKLPVALGGARFHGETQAARRASELLLVASLMLVIPMLGQSSASRETITERASRSDSPPAQAADEKVPTFKVDVRLVNVFVTVLGPNGEPVANLKREDFRLFEDGHEESVAVFGRESELPLSIVLEVDTSLSTRKDLHLELESARRFAHSIMRPVDSLSVYEFSDMVEEVVPFTADLKEIDRGLSNIKVGSATAMYDAVYLGSEALEKRQGRKVMVIITDGGDTVSKMDYQQALRAAQQAEAIVYSVIVVPIPSSAGRDLGGEHALIQLSHDTGGKHYYADSLDRLDDAFSHISEELRTQYLLAYYPSTRMTESGFRTIRVQVRSKAANGGPLRARHRAGYYYTSKPE